MSNVDNLVEKFHRGTGPQSFFEVKKVCDHFFGPPRVRGSHMIYRTPWWGDPRINIQNRNGEVPLYQVKQVLKALARLEEDHV